MASERTPDWTEIITHVLLEAIKERDPYTYGHCRRVSRNAKLLAKAAGLTDVDQKIVELSSLFHDIGKIGIPDSILNKKGRLTESEEGIMRLHPVKSAEILAPLSRAPLFKSILPGVRHHHERIDGGGYPDQLKGEMIPLYARIILIADTFDAMTTTRPYRNGLPHEVAYKELKLFAGRQFDRSLVQIFLKAHPTWGTYEEEITEEFISTYFRRAA